MKKLLSTLHICILFFLLGILSLQNKLIAQPQCPPPTGVSATPALTCVGKPITLAATIPSGTVSINWYTSATGGTPIATTNLPSTTYTPAAIGNYTFYAEAVGAGGPPTVQNFTYTGSVQQVTLTAGTYEIETWGANGYQPSGNNGLGGYAKGSFTIPSSQTVYIYVGGAGDYPNSVAPNTWTFNGGAIGHPASNSSYGNGGGASDVRTVGGTWDNAASLASRVIVGGGGGAGRGATFLGGTGGGLTGGNGAYFSPDQTGGPTGGTQTNGGVNSGYTPYCTPATLGKAMTWNGVTIPSQAYMAGGGGGYYGGASGRVAGAGGSSYTGGVTGGVTIMSGQTGFVTNPSGNGNGYVRISGLGASCIPGPRVATSVIAVGLTPIVDLGTDTFDCQSQQPSLTLDAGNNGASFLWDDNTVSQTRTVNQTGVYHVKVTNSFGCVATDTINVGFGTVPVIDLGPDTAFCADSIVLNGGNPGSQYIWHDNSINQQNTVDSSGKYYVTVTNQDGCTGSDTINVELIQTPKGYFDMNVWGGYNNPTYTFVAYLQNATSFFWDFGDGSPTSTNNPVNHTYMNIGTYVTKLHVFNDCGKEVILTSKPANIKVGINNIEISNSIEIYPNPVINMLNINAKDGQLIENITVLDALGRILITETIKQNHAKIDVSKLASGMYSIAVKTDKGVAVQKINVIGN